MTLSFTIHFNKFAECHSTSGGRTFKLIHSQQLGSSKWICRGGWIARGKHTRRRKTSIIWRESIFQLEERENEGFCRGVI